MRLFSVKRKVNYERNPNQKIGEIVTRTTRVKKYFWGIPIKTIHEYRKRFHGHLTAGGDKNLFI